MIIISSSTVEPLFKDTPNSECLYTVYSGQPPNSGQRTIRVYQMILSNRKTLNAPPMDKWAGCLWAELESMQVRVMPACIKQGIK